MERSKILLAILISLIVGIAVLSLGSDGRKNLDFDPQKFAISNLDELQTIEMQGPDFTHVFTQSDSGWVVNGSYRMDESLRSVLFRILDEVRVRRPVSRVSNQAVIQDLVKEGVHVQLNPQSGESSAFIVGGVASQSASYFLAPEEEQAYIMEIPGYSNYITAIFGLTELQWRDRMIFESPWQSIKSLTIDYESSDKKDISFDFQSGFPIVDGLDMAIVDTTKMMNYLEQYSYFETNELISLERFPRLDSLSQTMPMARIELEDLDNARGNTLTIFSRLEGEQVHLASDQNGNWSVIQRRRVERLLPTLEQFKIHAKPNLL